MNISKNIGARVENMPTDPKAGILVYLYEGEAKPTREGALGCLGFDGFHPMRDNPNITARQVQAGLSWFAIDKPTSTPCKYCGGTGKVEG